MVILIGRSGSTHDIFFGDEFIFPMEGNETVNSTNGRDMVSMKKNINVNVMSTITRFRYCVKLTDEKFLIFPVLMALLDFFPVKVFEEKKIRNQIEMM